MVPDIPFDFVGGLLRALCVSRAEDNGFSSSSPTQSQTHPCGAGST
jgi:hypothetical protein